MKQEQEESESGFYADVHTSTFASLFEKARFLG